MRIDQITSNPTQTAPIPAFNFLFASAEPRQSSRRKPSWLQRAALRTKRV
jgi:hypothetical protein